MPYSIRRLPLLLLPLLLQAGPAPAHQGPPFPILMDQRAGPWVVSVWADPDIGTGTFFVVLEPPEGRELPAGTSVRIAVRPVSGRLPEAVHPAGPQPARHGERHFAEVPFDQGGRWRVRILLEGPQGKSTLSAEVEPTPDGTLGPGELALYLLPFLAVGGLWLKAVLRRR